jgi:hypothetical protein
MKINWKKYEQDDEEDKRKFLNALMNTNGDIVNMIMQDLTVAIQVIHDYVRFKLYNIEDLSTRKLYIDERKMDKEIADRFGISVDNYTTILPFEDNPKIPVYYIKRHKLLRHLIDEKYPALKEQVNAYLNEVYEDEE